MLHVIGIEGVSRAGKTVFSRRLESDVFSFLWETESILENVDLTDNALVRQKFAELEIAKKQKLEAINKNIILDRTFFSSLAYTYAKSVVTGDSEDYEFNKSFFRQNKDKIIIPEKLLFFEVPPEESIRRRMEATDRDRQHPFWTNPDFLKAFTDYFRSAEFFELYPRENIQYIDTHAMDAELTYQTLRNELVKTLNLEQNSERGIEIKPKFLK